jgi:hypothetical protein
MPRYCFANHDEYSCAFILVTPSAGGVLREVDRARTPESQARVNSRRLDPIDQLLSITAGRNTSAEGIHERETEIAGARISRRNNYQDLTTFSHSCIHGTDAGATEWEKGCVLGRLQLRTLKASRTKGVSEDNISK